MMSHDAAWTQVSAANEELELDLSPRFKGCPVDYAEMF